MFSADIYTLQNILVYDILPLSDESIILQTLTVDTNHLTNTHVVNYAGSLYGMRLKTRFNTTNSNLRKWVGVYLFTLQ